MKQIETYATFEDYVSSIRAHDHAIPNVSQINEIGYDEYYIYDRIVLTNESNPELFAIAENAGWNYTSTSGVTNGELASLDIVDVMNAVVGQTALTKFNEFKYFSGITAIPRVLFSGIPLTEITIPASVTVIERGAFDSFPQNAKITYLNENVEFVDNLPMISVCYSGVTSNTRLCSSAVTQNNVSTKCMLIYVSGSSNNVFIKPEKFGYFVSGNTAITVENVIYVNYYLNSSEPWSYTFRSCQQLKTAEIVGDVTTLPYACFSACTSLEGVIMPNSVVSFANYAFGYCPSLSNVTIPTSVTGMGSYCFSGCGSLSSITIPDSVTSIGSYCFQYCSGLTSVTIPDSVTSIGSYCFYNCTSLTDITIPDSVTSIGYDCFYNCTSLTDITIPDSVTSIGSYCFYNCTGLEEVTIPDSVKTIGDYCFGYCTGLTDVVIGSGVTSAMSTYVFTGCSSITSVTINSTKLLNKTSNYSMSGYFGSQVVEYIIGDSVTTLGRQCFYNCSNLTDIRIGSGITSAGTSAFTNCTALTGVSIASQPLLNSGTSVSGYFGAQVVEYIVESGVTTLGNACFWNCYNATAITIPEGVLSLGSDCLGRCQSLRSLVIPDSVSSVGNYCFTSLVSLTGLTIGTGLTGFGLDCFYSAVSLTSVTIPDNIKVLGQSLFEAAVNLENVTIGSGVTSVAYNAFRYDEKITGLTCDSTGLATSSPSYYSYENYLQRNLQELVFGNNVSAVGLYFSGCSGLTSITFGDSVASINASAFTNLPNSASTVVTFTSTSVAPTGVTNKTFNYSPIHVPVGYEDMYVSAFTYYKKAGDGLLMAYDMSIEATYYAPAAYYGEQGVVAGESSPGLYYLGAANPATVPVRIFGSGSAKNRLLKIEIDNSIVIPASDVPASKFDYTFDTPGNHTVKFYYDGLTSIPNGMFTSASGLVNITIPDEITGIGSYAFFYCAGLTGISGCNNVTSISECAFRRTHSLTNFDIPKKVTYIGNGAFSASSIETIHIPSGVTGLGSAFAGFTSLRNAQFDSGSTISAITQSCFESCYNLVSISLPNSIKTIGHYAFRNCTGLTAVTLEDGITTIGSEAFRYCYSLKAINIPDSVTSINSHIFDNCTSLESVVIGSGLTGLTQNCFAYCKSLTSLTFSNTLTAIGNTCFIGCSSLKNLVLPSSIRSIGDSTFQDCTGIETLILPNGIQSISNNCFYACTGITGVTIPVSLTNFGSNAFNNCSNIKRVDYLGTLDDWCRITRQGNHEQWTSNPTYYSRNLYIGGNLVTTVNPTTATTSIGNYAFANITGITSVAIPDSVTALGHSCFCACSNLVDVSFGTGLTSLPQSCLRACSSLSAITIPGNIESIASHCFYQDTGLKEVVLEEGVRTVANDAFYNCSNMTALTVPTSVTSFGNNCFAGCSSLKRVDYLGTPEEWYTTISTVNYQSCPVYFSKHIYFNGEGDVVDSLTISAGTSVETRGFYYWTDLTAVTIESGTSLGTFEGAGLYEISIPSGVTIPSSWFAANCPNLQGYVNIPEGSITNLGDSEFYNSHLIQGASIPSSVTAITGSNAFNGCWLIDDIGIYPTTPPPLSNTNHFNNGNSMTKMYVPENSLSAYQTATNWKSYSGRMESIELTFTDQTFESVLVANGFDINGDGKIDKYEAAQIRDIGTIFAGTNITSTRDLELLYRVTGLTANAFSGCTGLTEIRIPGTVDTIGDNCFDGCSAAASATILGTRMTLGANIFSGSNVSTIYCFPGVLDSYAAYSAIKSEFSYIASDETNPVFMDVARENGWVSSTATAMTKAEAEAVTTIGTVFQNKKGIYHLCELQYFTGLTSIDNKGLGLLHAIVKVVIPEGVTTIGASGLAYNHKLEVVKLPNTLTTLNANALRDDSSLNRIEIPVSITSWGVVGDYTPLHEIFYNGTLAQWCAFSKDASIFTPVSASCKDRKLFINGSLLTAITIDSGIGSIMNNSFRGYKYAERVDILANKYFGTDCFYLADLAEVHYSGTLDEWCLNNMFASFWANPCTVSRNLYVNGNDLVTDLAPSTAVTAITNFSFAGVDSITSVTLPNTLKTIGNDGIRDCRSISSVTIPDSVTSLGGYAFDNCGSLTSVTLSSGLTGISNYCFARCSGLTSFNIPSNVKLIDNNAFSACTSLTSVTFNNNLVRLGNSAFDGCKSLTGVDLSNTVVSAMGSYCFSACVNLKSAYLPETIKSIGEGAFTYNYELTTVSNPSSSYTSVEAYTYRYCRNLTGITLSPNTTQIRHEAFSGCTSLTEITIPSKVSVIYRGAFNGCTALTTVNIESSAITMGDESVFKNCYSLTAFPFDKIVSASYGQSTFSGCRSLTNITLPNSLTAINYYDFEYCTGVTSITIPQSVKLMRRDAFRGMTSLENVYYGGTVDDWCTGITFEAGQDRPNPFAGNNVNGKNVKLYINGEVLTSLQPTTAVTKINPAAFFSYVPLTEVILPDTVTEIGSFAFRWCSGISSLRLPSGLTKVDTYALSRTGIKELITPYNEFTRGNNWIEGISLNKVVVMANDIASAGTATGHTFNSIFGGSVQEYVLSGNVTTVGPYRFYNSSGVKKITLGPNVVSAGTYSFFGCSGLTADTYNDSLFVYCSQANNSGATFNVPDTIKYIAAGAFRANYILRHIYIPSGVTNIYERTFESCEMLCSMVLAGPSVVSLQNINAFNNCQINNTGSFGSPDSRVRVPSELVSGYQSGTNWVTLYNNNNNVFEAL